MQIERNPVIKFLNRLNLIKKTEFLFCNLVTLVTWCLDSRIETHNVGSAS